MAAAVVVIGGANLDVKARAGHTVTAGTSNPGTVTTSPGGVARNVAENLARLGTPVRLLAAVGDDEAGTRLLAVTAAAGVDVRGVRRVAAPTGRYVAVLDATGDLVVAVSDMTATDGVRPGDLSGALDLLDPDGLLVVDGNLAADTVASALDVAAQRRCRVVADPVSVAKAAALATVLHRDRPVFTLTPNRDELAALTGHDTATPAGLAAAAAQLHGRGVELVWVRLGAQGSVLFARQQPAQHHAGHPGPVVDVTGAGDAMLAAFVHAVRLGRSPAEGVRYGHAAAALTVADEATVRPDLTAHLLDEHLAQLPRSAR